VFGTGAGWAREEFDALGVAYSERGPITDEYLRVILELWTSPSPEFHGSYVSLHDVSAEPRPVQQPHPPILIGGYGKRAIRRAVDIGQGWLPDGMSLPDLRTAIDYLRHTAESAGRDPDSLEVVLRTGLILGESRAAGRVADSSPTPWDQSSAFSNEESRLPFRGSVSEVIDDIHTAEGIGVRELIFESPVQRNDERFDTIEAFATEILPLFRTSTPI
jgi:alkanesulfonate monooxygenase SsuD/methylene tetrahydromethanopterin reductase-like flavin-dependent oxidoreductase (luciferase family)